jgi:predicted RNA-binding protein with TRAM domain
MAMPRVGVSVGVTFNIGNYESIRADARFDVDVEDWGKKGDGVQKAYRVCLEEAHMGLDAALEGLNKMLEEREAATPKPRRR